MFSVDYAYAPNAKGRDLFHVISLAPADIASSRIQCGCPLKLKVGQGESRVLSKFRRWLRTSPHTLSI